MSQKNKPKAVGVLTKEQNDRALGEMIARHVMQLSEHLGSVQIIATRLESDGRSSLFSMGSGDLFARCSAAEIWSERAHESLLNATVASSDAAAEEE